MSGEVAIPGDGKLRPWRELKAAAFRIIRRGPREILWTDPGFGWGNFLYYWMWAASGRVEGKLREVVRQPEMAPWISAFPALEELTINRSDVRLTDRRAVSAVSRFGDDFTEGDLTKFIQNYILPSRTMARHLSGQQLLDDGVLTIHIRRGSYYENPELAARYGMNTPAYLRVALDASLQQEPLKEVRVVTNDLEWCRTSLGWLGEYARSIRFGGRGATALEDFCELSTSRRLILSNSTFSYWGGYVSNVIYGDNFNLVWAPLFHMRRTRDWRAPQLNPKWNSVTTVPGGWWDPALGHEDK